MSNIPIAMVSSTVRDLPAHREKVRDACLRSNIFPSMMELWPAINEDGIKASLAKVDAAELYIGVFGFRYGFIPTGHSLSVTEMEYERAIERGIPRFIFLMDDAHPLLQEDVDKGSGAEKIRVLRERLKKERTVNFFKSPEELLAVAIHTLSGVPRKECDISHSTSPPLFDPCFPVFFVPYRSKGDQVIGREVPLDAIRKQLTEGKRTAIGQTASFQGLGGLGKTQLAVEYAYTFRSFYPNGVIWINADQDIDAQLSEIATTAKWVSPNAKINDKLETASRRLKETSGCLVIFDNLEDHKAIRDYLPTSQAEPHILVTSRIDQPDFVPVPLDVLDLTASLQLLIQEAGRDPSDEHEKKAAVEIASSLGGLPLALELAGAFLQHRAIRWDDYLVLLRENLRAALPEKYLRASFTRHESDLHSTLKINERVFEEEPRLRDIMETLTWSAAAPMGRELLSSLIDCSEGALASALSLGVSLRLLQTTSNGSYALHRLIREVRREDEWIKERTEWVRERCRRLCRWFESVKRDFADVARFESEVDHLRAWLSLVERDTSELPARLIWLLAYPPFHRAQYRDAKELLEQASAINNGLSQPDELLQANIWNDAATIYIQVGDIEVAFDVAQKALATRQRLLGENHADTAMSHNNLGGTLRWRNDFKGALHHAEQAYRIWFELYGEYHIDTVLALSNIAGSYRGLNEHSKALEIDRRTLEIREKLFGDNHPETITSILALALDNVILKQGKEAERLADWGLKAARQVFGEQNVFTATGLSVLADAYAQNGKLNDACVVSEKAFNLRSKLLGNCHREVARSAIQLANLYVHRGLSGKAFALLNSLLKEIPANEANRVMLLAHKKHLESTIVRPGFRQQKRR